MSTRVKTALSPAKKKDASEGPLISTFHSFCMKICREYGLEKSSVDGGGTAGMQEEEEEFSLVLEKHQKRYIASALLKWCEMEGMKQPVSAELKKRVGNMLKELQAHTHTRTQPLSSGLPPSQVTDISTADPSRRRRQQAESSKALRWNSMSGGSTTQRCGVTTRSTSPTSSAVLVKS